MKKGRGGDWRGLGTPCICEQMATSKVYLKNKNNIKLAAMPNRVYVEGDSEKTVMGRDVWYEG